MNTNKLGFMRPMAAVGVLSIASQLASPVIAFAEEGGGADILIPKPAEFIPALIAFLAIWVIMAKMAWPMIIKILDERQEKIENDFKEAETAKAQAQQEAQTYHERIEDAERKAEEILANAKHEAEVMRADMLAKAQEDAQAIISKAHDVIDAEREKAMAELSGSVVDLSVEIASKVIGDGLSEQQQRELATKYLAEVGSLNED